MRIFIYVVTGVYFIAINLYSLILMVNQKKEYDYGNDVHDGKIILSGVLGGAVTVYAFMLIKKYRLSNVFLMVAMPVFSAITGFLIYFVLSFDFTAIKF